MIPTGLGIILILAGARIVQGVWRSLRPAKGLVQMTRVDPAVFATMDLEVFDPSVPCSSRKSAEVFNRTSAVPAGTAVVQPFGNTGLRGEKPDTGPFSVPGKQIVDPAEKEVRPLLSGEDENDEPPQTHLGF